MNSLRQTLLIFCLFVVAGSVPRVAAQVSSVDASPVPMLNAQPTAKELQQLVAPIALYPDALVAQVLAAATYPDQIVEADRWIQQHPDVKGAALARQVDPQPWDPSVKALTAFPSVLGNLDKNLSWTSSLGDAYVNHQQDVMDAVQQMRSRAQNARNLTSTGEQTVREDRDSIVIEPVDPEVVYVPTFDPWIVYGAPIVAWPGWYWYPGLYVQGPDVVFGVGFDVGRFGAYPWGWHHWAPDWQNRAIIFNHNTYITHSRTFINRNYFRSDVGDFAGGFHPAPAFHGAPVVVPRGSPGMHSGAFSGFGHGAVAKRYAFGGKASFGGAHGGFRVSGAHR
jgi:hypothetical protein